MHSIPFQRPVRFLSRHRAIFFALLLVFLHPPLLAAATVDDVIRAWKTRQDQTRGVRITWQRRTSAEGDRFSRYQAQWATDTNPASYVFSLEGDRLYWSAPELSYEAFELARAEADKFAGRQPAPVLSTEQLCKQACDVRFEKVLETHDVLEQQALIQGGTRETLWLPGAGDYPRCLIRKLPDYGRPSLLFHAGLAGEDGLHTLFCLAPLIVYRPLHAGFTGVRPGNCALREQTARIQGQECLVLDEKVEGDRCRRTYWIDPARQFHVLRYVGRDTDQTGVQLDFTYSSHPAHGWIPATWSALRLDQDGLDPVAASATAVDVSVVVNRSIPAREQALDHPQGTWILDEPANQQNFVSASGVTESISGDPLQTATECRTLHGVGWPSVVADLFCSGFPQPWP